MELDIFVQGEVLSRNAQGKRTSSVVMSDRNLVKNFSIVFKEPMELTVIKVESKFFCNVPTLA